MSLLRPEVADEPVKAPGRLPHSHPFRHRVAVAFTVLLAVLVGVVKAGVAYLAIQNARLDKISGLNKRDGDWIG